MTIQETSVIYRAEGETSLKLHLFLPDKNAGRRAAILFFHGGRFIQGHPAQFFPHCRYFASRGMVAASATYRLLGKNARTVLDCFADSRAAIEWLRTHADDLAIDPAQVVLAGGSAGANLAANAAMGLPEEQRNDASRISSAPDALVLFSPAVVRPRAEQDLLDARLYAQLRPRAHLPPMLLLHGGEDEVFALDALQDFCQQMTLAGNICQLQLYPGGRHGFFNYRAEDTRPFFETVGEVERFLGRLGLLQGNSTLSGEQIKTLRHEGDWQT